MQNQLEDIIEKAHITPYCETADDSFENLIILCPNCHKIFDKISSFNLDKVKEWKQIRREQIDRLFSKQYSTFDDLKTEVVPLLLENKTIYENYYLSDKKELWNKFEGKILANNRKLKKIFEQNLDLFQRHREKAYSNLACINSFIMHVDEFEATRPDEEKCRHVLFPKEINSMFGIAPISGFMLPFTESLEKLLTKLNEQGKLEAIVVGINKPYILLNKEGKSDKVFLDDTPRLRQLYYDYNCFKSTKVRLDSLNFALKYLKSQKIDFKFLSYNNLREISANGVKIIFVYEYCLSKVDLLQLAPEENNVIVNLHNWNGVGCISNEAYKLSEEMNVTLLTMDKFYEYINKIKHKG